MHFIKNLKTASLILFTSVLISCGGAPDSNFQMVDFESPEMIAAVEDARATLPKFWELKAANDPALSEFWLKVGLATYDDSLEHIWVEKIQVDGKGYSGILANDPVAIPDVKYGDRVKFIEADITDWQYMKNRKLHGHYSSRVMLKNMPEKDARHVKALLSKEP